MLFFKYVFIVGNVEPVTGTVSPLFVLQVARKRVHANRCALLVIAIQVVLILVLVIVGVFLYMNYDFVRSITILPPQLNA